MKDKLVKYFPHILIGFHLIGLFLFIAWPAMIVLTPLNLMLSGFLVFFTETNKKISVAYLLIFLFGFLVELVGVQTGFLFGNYRYSNILSEGVGGVPLIIGVNWFVIVVSSVSLFNNFRFRLWLRVILSGLAAVLMDFIIEPVAIKYEFWIWENNTVPLYNYVCWFVFSAGFSWLYLSFKPAGNRTAFALYFTWLGFFLILNFI